MKVKRESDKSDSLGRSNKAVSWRYKDAGWRNKDAGWRNKENYEQEGAADYSKRAEKMEKPWFFRLLRAVERFLPAAEQ